ncbi:MAG: hypothetical protein HZB29_09850 [Nitrospinae bacterium]|nr:hypothetical protein [Nitrospinota bacterium]
MTEYNPRSARRHILTIINDLFEHAVSDKQVRESLREFSLDLSTTDIRREFAYLAGLGAVTVDKNEGHDMETCRITPHGVDILTGAVEVDGVRTGDPLAENLYHKKDLRRGVLAHLAEKPAIYVEDVDLAERFAEDGFGAVELADVQYHLWYLAGKTLVTLREIRVGKANNYTAKITPAGVDVYQGLKADVGITADASR